MAIREIRKEGDEILSKKCREVEEITDKILELGQDMLDTMYKYDGIGLAASQVGILKRVIVLLKIIFLIERVFSSFLLLTKPFSLRYSTS